MIQLIPDLIILSKEIRKKMDSSNIVRIISMIQNVLKKIQLEIDQIKSEILYSQSQKNNWNPITKSFDKTDILLDSFCETRLISSSTSCPLKSSQSCGLSRPNTTIPTSIMNRKIKKNCNEPNAPKKSKNNDFNNISIIQKVSSVKHDSNPKKL